jgi:hypothetical protein
MAKLVEGRVAAAHFGCCVLCVVCCGCGCDEFYSYTGREAKIGPAKMANFSALRTKNASLDAPNVKGVQNCHFP